MAAAQNLKFDAVSDALAAENDIFAISGQSLSRSNKFIVLDFFFKELCKNINIILMQILINKYKLINTYLTINLV